MKIKIEINDDDLEDFLSGDGVDTAPSMDNYLSYIATKMSEMLLCPVECETSGIYDHNISVEFTPNCEHDDEYFILTLAEEYYSAVCSDAANALDEILVYLV